MIWISPGRENNLNSVVVRGIWKIVLAPLVTDHDLKMAWDCSYYDLRDFAPFKSQFTWSMRTKIRASVLCIFGSMISSQIPEIPWWNPHRLVVWTKIFLHLLDCCFVLPQNGVEVQKLNLQVWQTLGFSFSELFAHHECCHLIWLDWSKLLSDHFFWQKLANSVWNHLKEEKVVKKNQNYIANTDR